MAARLAAGRVETAMVRAAGTIMMAMVGTNSMHRSEKLQDIWIEHTQL